MSSKKFLKKQQNEWDMEYGIWKQNKIVCSIYIQEKTKQFHHKWTWLNQSMTEEDFYLKEKDREKTAYALKEGTTTKRGDKFDV